MSTPRLPAPRPGYRATICRDCGIETYVKTRQPDRCDRCAHPEQPAQGMLPGVVPVAWQGKLW